MSDETYVPKHRSAPVSKRRPLRLPSVKLPTPQLRVPAVLSSVSMPAMFANPQAKRILVASSIAVAATGVAVSTGVAGSTAGGIQLAASAGAKATGAGILADRVPEVSRSLDRQALARTVKAAALSSVSGAAVTGTVHINPVTAAVAQGDPKAITLALMPSFGFSTSDFSCIDQIWTQESGWNLHAANPSGAYGIPQALPGSKMASAGPDWQNNATTQIKWGLGYIKSSYGTPCNAAAFKLSHGWY